MRNERKRFNFHFTIQQVVSQVSRMRQDRLQFVRSIDGISHYCLFVVLVPFTVQGIRNKYALTSIEGNVSLPLLASIQKSSLSSLFVVVLAALFIAFGGWCFGASILQGQALPAAKNTHTQRDGTHDERYTHIGSISITSSGLRFIVTLGYKGHVPVSHQSHP